MTDHLETRNALVQRAIAACCVVMCSITWADVHPAKFIPKSAAAFVVFPHLADSNVRISAFAARVQNGFPGFDLSEFEMTAGFAPGTIDLTKPIVVIADRPEELFQLFSGSGLTQGDPVWPVVGFVPKDPAGFKASLRDAGKQRSAQGVKNVVGAFGTYRVVMRDGFAFVAPRSAAVAKIVQLPEDQSAWSEMSAAARRDVLHSDVFIQLSMSSWRPLFEAKLRAITQIMKFGIQVQQADPKHAEQTRELADWFFSGALDGVNQMETASAALMFHGDRVRLSHHHTFRAGEWMVDYLDHVKRVEHGGLWRSFPDRPFLFGMVSNWKVPPDYCLAVRFNRRCMDDPKLCKSLSKEARSELNRDISTLAKNKSVEEFVITNQPHGMLPLRIVGTYAFKDAPQMVEVMQRVREHSKELLGSIMPGATEAYGKSTLVQIDGLAVHRMKLTDTSTSQIIQDNIRRMYGVHAVYQEAAVDNDTIIYSIGDPDSIRGLAEACRNKAPTLAANPSVDAAMAAMPADANLYALIDTRRLIESIPQLIHPGVGSAIASDNSAAEGKASIGPLLGWSATVHGRHVDCGFTMKSEDLLHTIRAFDQMRRQLGRPGGGGAPEQGLATDRPVPFAWSN